MTHTDLISHQSRIQWIADLAKAIQLREGVEGIIRCLWALYGKNIRSTRDWSAAVQIPVPVLAALRKELEKRNILNPGPKLSLHESGFHQLETLFGKQEWIDTSCLACHGTGRFIPPEIMPVLEEFKGLCEKRPNADVTLDQSHATPETGIRKALLLLEKGLLSRPLFLMGDDDFISLACLLIRKRFISNHEKCGTIMVADIDSRYLDSIRALSQEQIQVRHYDIRDELPTDLHDRFSVALTDPAYTENGITVFSYRCQEALETHGTLLLSMPFSDGLALGAIQTHLLNMSFVFREIHIGFNRYHGACLHASQTNLIIAEKIGLPPEKSIRLRYTPLYTGDIRTPGAIYSCSACNIQYPVGTDCKYLTIHELKKAGCENCGNNVFRRISARDFENEIPHFEE